MADFGQKQPLKLAASGPNLLIVSTSLVHVLSPGAISGGGGSTSASADVLEKGIDSIDITQELVRLRNGPLLARRM